ncbi:MAG: transmembrane electron transporter [Zestosphaera sp.]
MNEFPGLLGLLVSWALADSVDPCIFVLFVSILTSASLIGVKHVAKVGVSFIAATFAGYMIFGFLLRILASGLPRWLMASVMIFYGLASLLSLARGRKSDGNQLICREDELPCRIASMLGLNKILRAEVLSTAVLGLIVSFTLLPCSAGLYILYNVIMSQYGFLTLLPLTMLYVAIFESPLVLVLLVFVGVSRVRSVHEVLLSRERPIRALGALMMIVISFYLFLTP